MPKIFAAFALSLILCMPAAQADNDPLVAGFFATHLEGAYSMGNGQGMAYMGYANDMILVVDGRSIDARVDSIDLKNKSVNFTVTRGDQPEQMTFKRALSFGIMTMGDGSTVNMRYVRRLTDADVEVIKTARRGGAAAPAQTAVKPSFDCARASTAVEGMICGNAELASLDARTAEAYKAVREGAEDRAAMQREQVEWIQQTRDACGSAECLAQAYSERAEDLEQLASYLSKPAEFR